MQVLFYRADNGSCPMIDFMKQLPPVFKARVLHDIDLLEEKGNKIGMPYSRSLGDGLYELIRKARSYKADHERRSRK